MHLFMELLNDLGTRYPRAELETRRRALATVVAGLTASPEPAVVLSSLARSCVPAFSDTCRFELVEPDRPTYRFRYPTALRFRYPTTVKDERNAKAVVRTPVRHDATAFGPAYRGELVHSWTDVVPGPADAQIAAILVDCALDVVNERRIATALTRAEHPTATMTSTMRRMRAATHATYAFMDDP